MIFTFSCTSNNTKIETGTYSGHIEKVLEDFKEFLAHCGYHPNNVEAITYNKTELQQGLPQQLDLFDERVGG